MKSDVRYSVLIDGMTNGRNALRRIAAHLDRREEVALYVHIITNVWHVKYRINNY